MPSALGFIGGGLLQGVGKGLVLTGKQKREKKLKEIEHQRALERDEKQMEGRRGLLGTELDARKTAAGVTAERAKNAAKLTAGAKVEASETAAGVSKTAATVLNERKVEAARLLAKNKKEVARIQASAAQGDISAADKRAIDIAVKRHTKAGSIVDNEKVIQQLLGMNRRDLAELYAGGPIGPTGLSQEQAEKRVDEEAKERKEFFKSRADEFPETDGDEAAWRKLRLSQLAPQSANAASAPVAPAAPLAPTSSPAATPPQAAIGHLKANPALAPQFDQKYGAGAAAKVLGR